MAKQHVKSFWKSFSYITQTNDLSHKNKTPCKGKRVPSV